MVSRARPPSKYKFGGDGWMSVTTHAGGADEVRPRVGDDGARAARHVHLERHVGGFNRFKSSVFSAVMSSLCFIGVEVRDGFFYEFSFSDLTGDSIGMVLALLLDNFPKLREVFVRIASSISRAAPTRARSPARRRARSAAARAGTSPRITRARRTSPRSTSPASGGAQQARQAVALRRRRGRVRQPRLQAAAGCRHRQADPPGPVHGLVDQRAGHLRHDLRESHVTRGAPCEDDHAPRVVRRCSTCRSARRRLFGVDPGGPVRALKPPPPRPALPSGSAS